MRALRIARRCLLGSIAAYAVALFLGATGLAADAVFLLALIATLATAASAVACVLIQLVQVFRRGSD